MFCGYLDGSKLHFVFIAHFSHNKCDHSNKFEVQTSFNLSSAMLAMSAICMVDHNFKLNFMEGLKWLYITIQRNAKPYLENKLLIVY